MTKMEITIGDFEIVQLVLKSLNFECVSYSKCVNKKIFRKDGLDITIEKKIPDE